MQKANRWYSNIFNDRRVTFTRITIIIYTYRQVGKRKMSFEEYKDIVTNGIL